MKVSTIIVLTTAAAILSGCGVAQSEKDKQAARLLGCWVKMSEHKKYGPYVYEAWKFQREGDRLVLYQKGGFSESVTPHERSVVWNAEMNSWILGVPPLAAGFYVSDDGKTLRFDNKKMERDADCSGYDNYEKNKPPTPKL